MARQVGGMFVLLVPDVLAVSTLRVTSSPRTLTRIDAVALPRRRDQDKNLQIYQTDLALWAGLAYDA